MSKKYYYLFELLLLFLLTVLLYIIPLDFIESKSFCMFKNSIGVQCFGCGLTRAFFNLLHFNLNSSLTFNPLIVVFAPLLFYIYIRELLSILQIMRGSRDISFIVGILCYIKDI